MDPLVLIQAFPGPVLMVNRATSHILGANKHSAELYGCNTDALKQLTLSDLVHQGDVARFLDNPTQLVHQVHRAGCRTVDVKLHGQPWETADDSLLLVFLTEIKATPETAQTVQRRLTQHELATQKYASLTLLMGGVAHDFNNMITGLLGYTELAKLQSPPGSPVAEYLSHAEQITLRAAELCQQLLNYARQTLQQTRIMDMAELVQDTRALLQSMIGRRFTMEFHLESSWVNGDATELRQVVMNLVKNAADAHTQHVGRVYVSTGRRYFTRGELEEGTSEVSLPEGTYCFLEVRDTGAGIPPEIRQHIFSPYFTTKPKGTGLGLASVRSIADCHGGTVLVNPALTGGSVFTLVLPMAMFPEEEALKETPGPRIEEQSLAQMS